MIVHDSEPDSGPIGRPLIGLTCYTSYRPDWKDTSVRLPTDHLLRSYTRCVERAGGLPIMIPLYADSGLAGAIIERIDGLLLTGGPDISPEHYHDVPKPGLRDVDGKRDWFELALVRAAIARNLPIMGICRGLQLLNVAFGGDLNQDLKNERPSAIEHEQNLPRHIATHTVRIESGARLAVIVGDGEIRVNSGHHQGIHRLAPGFIVSATSPDGLIEAIERPGRPFLMGVQWHPEGTAEWDAASQALFRAFVRSCL